jgi:hypothetical protein
MDTLLENAQRIFDVARASGDGDQSDFALLIRPDGGLHFVMEAGLADFASQDAAAIANASSNSMRHRVTRPRFVSALNCCGISRFTE